MQPPQRLTNDRRVPEQALSSPERTIVVEPAMVKLPVLLMAPPKVSSRRIEAEGSGRQHVGAERAGAIMVQRTVIRHRFAAPLTRPLPACRCCRTDRDRAAQAVCPAEEYKIAGRQAAAGEVGADRGIVQTVGSSWPRLSRNDAPGNHGYRARSQINRIPFRVERRPVGDRQIAVRGQTRQRDRRAAVQLKLIVGHARRSTVAVVCRHRDRLVGAGKGRARRGINVETAPVRGNHGAIAGGFSNSSLY